MRSSYAALRALVVVGHVASLFAAPAMSYAATASMRGLPSPQVSRALDAVLLPIDPAVVEAFKLREGTHGVLVLAVQPGGVAAKQGIEPGDVLSEVRGRKIAKPIDVDIAVKRSLKAGPSGIPFAVVRNGAPVAVVAVITLAEYDEVVSISEVSTWESYTSESSVSYSEFVSEESQSIESSYESEEATVEEATLTEESSEETSDPSADDTASDEAGAADDDGDDAGTQDDRADDGADDDGAADDDSGSDDDGGSDDSDG